MNTDSLRADLFREVYTVLSEFFTVRTMLLEGGTTMYLFCYRQKNDPNYEDYSGWNAEMRVEVKITRSKVLIELTGQVLLDLDSIGRLEDDSDYYNLYRTPEDDGAAPTRLRHTSDLLDDYRLVPFLKVLKNIAEIAAHL